MLADAANAAHGIAAVRKARAAEIVPPFFLDWPALVNASSTPAKAAALIDGREVDSCAPEYRAECEARHVLALHSLFERRAYLARVEKRRGEESRRALETLILAVFEARRNG